MTEHNWQLFLSFLINSYGLRAVAAPSSGVKLSGFYCDQSFLSALVLSSSYFTTLFRLLPHVIFSPVCDHPSLQSILHAISSHPLFWVSIPLLYLLHLLLSIYSYYRVPVFYRLSQFFYLWIFSCFYSILTLLSGSMCLLCSAWAPTSRLQFESQSHSVHKSLSACVWWCCCEFNSEDTLIDSYFCIFVCVCLCACLQVRDFLRVYERGYKHLCFKAWALLHLATAYTLAQCTLCLFSLILPPSPLSFSLSFNPTHAVTGSTGDEFTCSHAGILAHTHTHTVALLLVFKQIWWRWFRLCESFKRMIFKKRPFGYYGNDSNMTVTRSS